MPAYNSDPTQDPYFQNARRRGFIADPSYLNAVSPTMSTGGRITNPPRINPYQTENTMVDNAREDERLRLSARKQFADQLRQEIQDKVNAQYKQAQEGREAGQYGMKTAEFPYELRSKQADAEKKQNEMDDESMRFRSAYNISRPDLKSTLESSTTGYSDPRVSAYVRDPFKIEKMKAAATAEAREGAKPPKPVKEDDTSKRKEAVLTFIASLDPEKSDRGAALREMAYRFPTVKLQSDPDIQAAIAKAYPPAQKKAGLMGKLMGMMKPKQEAAAAPTQASDLPPVQGVTEGSFLKKNGQRTHVLKNGQWQTIH